MSSGKSVNRLKQSKEARKRKKGAKMKKSRKRRKKRRKRKNGARTSLAMEQTTEDDRARPKLDRRAKHGPAKSRTSMTQLLRSYRTKA